MDLPNHRDRAVTPREVRDRTQMQRNSQAASLRGALGPSSTPQWSDLENVHKLCQRCRDIPWASIRAVDAEFHLNDITYQKWPLLYAPSPSLREVLATALWGCHFCTLIVIGLRESFQSDYDFSGGWSFNEQSLLEARVGWHIPEDDGGVGVIHVQLGHLEGMLFFHT